MSVRVFHVITGIGPGGAETVLYRVVTGSIALEHEIASFTDRDWYSSRLEARGIRVHYLRMRSAASGVAAALRLNRLIRDSGADLVQCWMYRANVLGGLLARVAGIPVVWNIRCSSPELLRFSSRLWAHAARFLSPFIPALVVNCSARSAETHEKLGYSWAKVEVIPNGYDPQEFYPDDTARRLCRVSLGLADETFVVGSVARWDVYKDIPMLLRAVRIAHERGVRLRCLLVGHLLDSGNTALVNAVENAGCTGIVIPLGRRDVHDFARAMDLHVLASRSEGFPNVVAETMLCGTPNAVTDVGDAALIVGDTGWVRQPRNPELLAAAIEAAYREWSERPNEWANRRSIARQRIIDSFSLERMVARYESLWKRVVEEKTGS